MTPARYGDRSMHRLPKTLTVEELGDYLRVTPDTIREWVRKGRIPCYRIGRKTIRFDLDEVVAALREARPQRRVER